LPHPTASAKALPAAPLDSEKSWTCRAMRWLCGRSRGPQGTSTALKNDWFCGYYYYLVGGFFLTILKNNEKY
jgi:hypothetical protein